LEIGEKPGIFGLTYQPHSSSADCAVELLKFEPSKDLASLRVCNEKKILLLGFVYFGIDVIRYVFGHFCCWYLTWAQPLDGSILLKFSFGN